MWNRVELKMRGKQAFQYNYWPCVGAAFIMSVISMVFNSGGAGRSTQTLRQTTYYHDSTDLWNGSSYADTFSGGLPALGALFGAVAVMMALFGTLLMIFVGNVLEVGGKRFFVRNQTERVSVGTVLDGFRSGHYGNIVLTMFLRDLFTFLWSLLFIIPGIVKSYEYRMIPYILSENPGMSYKEAFAISKRMRTGQKLETFIMDLSFIGWYLLGGITCGIVNIFYVMPYVEASFAEMYSFNRAKAYGEGYIR